MPRLRLPRALSRACGTGLLQAVVLQLRHVESKELMPRMGQCKPAQGNALGIVCERASALKGRNKMVIGRRVPPLQGLISCLLLPRALPWAGLLQAVGLQLRRVGSKRSSQAVGLQI